MSRNELRHRTDFALCAVRAAPVTNR